jgi:hypothetical protein
MWAVVAWMMRRDDEPLEKKLGKTGKTGEWEGEGEGRARIPR